MSSEQMQYTLVLSNDSVKNPNISVSIEKNEIKIAVNARRIFRTLSNRELLLAAMDKKFTELLQMHLQEQANKEDERRCKQ